MNKDEKERLNDMYEKMKKNNYSEKEQKQKVEEAEKKASNLGKVSKNFLLMLEMIKDYWNGEFEISKLELAIMIGAIAYVALPLDVVPDFIPIAGFADDISVVGIAISNLNDLINRYKKFKNNKK